MKITIVSDGKGKLLASVFGHVSEQTRRLGDPENYPSGDVPMATLVCQPGQKFLEVDVPDKYEKLSPDALHKALKKDFLK